MQSRPAANRQQSLSAIVLLAFSLGISFQASRYPFGTVSKVGPGFLPFYLGLILAGLSIILLLKAILAPEREEAKTPLTAGKLGRVAAVFLSMVAYAFLLGRLGFPVTTFLFTLALFKFAERYRWGPALLGALAAAVINHFVFGVWLQCQFPDGWLGF
ncbi:MAG TPA: tripartite tricarboxylate transporter TctB family protein [Thermodesulfobacteriota bacterium]|nr:tripartite tricarboxylate transporter TctB family protein [Thermodesulfobacteriota bacterium]